MTHPKRPPPAGATPELLQQGYRYALSLTHDETRAEDILQDACVAILRSQGSWNRGYLFKAIRHRFVDLYRRELVAPMEGIEDSGEVPERVEDAIGSETMVVNADFLHKALGRLRVEEREALFLAAVEGYTAAEIGELTGRPRGTILSLVFRARRKIDRLARPREAKDEP
ncbi:MAG: RNA polymerase sigma factor [Candidatus Binatia bacterium]